MSKVLVGLVLGLAALVGLASDVNAAVPVAAVKKTVGYRGHGYYHRYGTRFHGGWYFRGRHHNHWGYRTWNSYYRRYHYWDSDLRVYYYWNEGYGCYYPVGY
jgi:hypothetical protein